MGGIRIKTPALARGFRYQWRVSSCNALGCERTKWREFYIREEESRLWQGDNWMLASNDARPAILIAQGTR